MACWRQRRHTERLQLFIGLPFNCVLYSFTFSKNEKVRKWESGKVEKRESEEVRTYHVPLSHFSGGSSGPESRMGLIRLIHWNDKSWYAYLQYGTVDKTIRSGSHGDISRTWGYLAGHDLNPNQIRFQLGLVPKQKLTKKKQKNTSGFDAQQKMTKYGRKPSAGNRPKN